jgi:glycosyltransferase involved in cell wall biosynthesis
MNAGQRSVGAAPLPAALVLGPSLKAISGVTTHVDTLLRSPLRSEFALAHFQVGSEGRSESALGRLVRLLASPFGLAAAIFRNRAAIVHLNTSLNAKAYWRDLAYLLVARLCGARVVLQKHGGTLRGFSRNGAMAAFVRATMRLADAIVVLSRAEMSDYRGVGNVVHLPNGIDCAPYLRYNRSLPEGRLRLVYIGRIAPRKGLSEILAALVVLREQYPRIDAELVVAGSGPDEAKLRIQAKALGVQRSVRFAGPTCGEEKVRLLARSDVLLLPSHSEGLPYALLEAMAAGVVPVVTPVGAIPEVVQDGLHGCVVPVGDAAAIASALARLASDRALLARMSAACRGRVAASYSIERLAEEFASLYTRVL